MENRIDPLIAERAPWLYRNNPSVDIARRALLVLLGYRKTIDIAKAFTDAPADQIMAAMGKMLAQTVTAKGLGHIPSHGPCLIVANHPTGIADGIILNHLIARRRTDAYFFANRDIIRVFPQLDSVIAPVEWRKELRDHTKTRATLAYVREATAAGRIGVIFPSGRLAKRRGLKLYERPWMASAAMIARKYELPVIPINIQARNSALFYLFDLLHPTLRDIMLFHETLNKGSQPFEVTVGEPISPAAIPRKPAEAITLLRNATLGIGGKDAPAVNLAGASRSWLKPRPATEVVR